MAGKKVYPRFATQEEATRETDQITKQVAAYRLGVPYSHLADKFIRTQLIHDSKTLMATEVDALAERPFLQAVEGELTVLRAPGKKRDDNGDLVGLSIEDTNDELERVTLGWWRGNADRVLHNRLFAVTVGGLPAVLWELTGIRSDSLIRGTEVRYQYSGNMLARVQRRDRVGEEYETEDKILFDDPRLGHCTTFDARYVKKRSKLYEAVSMIMSHRIRVDSGGPIGYLTPSGEED